jgi:hypothetical protein
MYSTNKYGSRAEKGLDITYDLKKENAASFMTL